MKLITYMLGRILSPIAPYLWRMNRGLGLGFCENLQIPY